jgi:dTDP-4-dehydrorhamnose reductase
MARWLVTGGTGQVGGALVALLGERAWAPGRDSLDLFALPDDAELDALLGREGIGGIVNCGAWTAVDAAEEHRVFALAANADAPRRLACAAARRGIPIVHVSTDYVFPGDLEGRAYREDDSTGPHSEYGRTKLSGEIAVRESGARHAIVRTAWVVSATGNNFIKTMLRLGAERDELRVVADQHGCPTHAGDLAAALLHIGERFLTDHDQPSGLWHFANVGETTWHGLAEHVFARAASLGLPVPQLSAITTADYPTPAKRPANSRLDIGKIYADFGIRPRPWREAVDEIVDALANSAKERSP